MNSKTPKQRGLGRGLSALMADVTEDRGAGTDGPGRSPDRVIAIESIHPNPDQPRRSFDEAQLQDLAASIAAKGIIQPLIVRVSPRDSDAFEIVAGERRWRAAQIARLHEIPVILREYDDTEVLEIAIIENIQRADLNPVEEAAGFHQLMQKFGHTQEKLANVLGKSRSHIANSVRLLALPDSVQTHLRDGRLSAGHARALITSDNPEALAARVIKKNLSVRETEKLAKNAHSGSAPERTSTRPGKPPSKDADTQALESDLSATLGMKVSLNHVPGQEAGQVTIHYTSLDQLDQLCQLLGTH